MDDHLCQGWCTPAPYRTRDAGPSPSPSPSYMWCEDWFLQKELTFKWLISPRASYQLHQRQIVVNFSTSFSCNKRIAMCHQAISLQHGLNFSLDHFHPGDSILWTTSAFTHSILPKSACLSWQIQGHGSEWHAHANECICVRKCMCFYSESDSEMVVRLLHYLYWLPESASCLRQNNVVV